MKLKQVTLKSKVDKIIAALLVVTFSVSGLTASMDPDSRNLLISKFEKVLVGLAPADPAYTSVSLRLADLLSERARVDVMNELQKGCIECNAGVKDRKSALKLYESVLAKVPAESQGKIIFQIGHLNEMLGQSQKAEAVYLNIIRDNKSGALVAESRAALGEMYFKQRRFPQAREQFEAARKGELGQQGLASYRIAWCLYNEGKVAEGASELKSILKSPKLLTRNGTSGVVSIDKQFQDEVSRDYATFLGRLGPSSADVVELYQLSPENTRLEHVEFLATELERTGSKDKAIIVWQFTQERQTQPRNRLEGSVRLSQLYMEVGKHDEATREYEKSLALWGQVQCDQSCAELKSRMRKFVIDWNRLQKKSLTPAVLQAYENYLSVFTDDTEMIFWGAQVARELKNYPKSLELFQNFVAQGSTKLSTLKPGKEKQDLETNIENALLNQIEVAELSKDTATQLAVYDRYLQFSPKGAKRVEVKYQKAHLTYKQEKYEDAAVQLREVALLPTKESESIRTQAADLALDALALLKDDARLELWSKEFANKFTAKRAEYLAVARKSVLNQSAAAVNGASGDSNAAWMVLARADISGADDADKIVYLKNKLILAEKLGKYSEARNAADALLKIPGLKAEDQEFALARKSWLAELALDFNTAYVSNQKMKLSELKPDDKTLRLAMFAELADQNPKSYYEEYIRTTSNKENARLVAARLVRESKTPVAEIAKFERLLKDDPALLAQLNLEAYAKNKDIKTAIAITKNKALVQTPAGKEFVREVLLSEIQPLGASLAQMSIGTKTQGEISRGIKARVAGIEKLEAVVGRAVESTDWIAQVVGLSILGREIERFYSEIIALPVPAGLSPEEEGQYLQLLSQQASPYQVKASDIKSKLNEFWSGGQIQKVLADYKELTGDLRGLYAVQLAVVESVAPSNEKANIASTLSSTAPGAKNMPTVAEVELARKLVRENPMNADRLLKLSKLEKQMGRTTMASYLEARAQKSNTKSEGDVK